MIIYFQIWKRKNEQLFFYLIKKHIIFSYNKEPSKSLIVARPNISNSNANDTNFIITLSNESSKSSKLPWQVTRSVNTSVYQWPLPRHIAKTLSFYVDGSFDESTRKWLWSDGTGIKANTWDYSCFTIPHQPATDLVVTITDKEIF